LRLLVSVTFLLSRVYNTHSLSRRIASASAAASARSKQNAVLKSVRRVASANGYSPLSPFATRSVARSAKAMAPIPSPTSCPTPGRGEEEFFLPDRAQARRRGIPRGGSPNQWAHSSRQKFSSVKGPCCSDVEWGPAPVVDPPKMTGGKHVHEEACDAGGHVESGGSVKRAEPVFLCRQHQVRRPEEGKEDAFRLGVVFGFVRRNFGCDIGHLLSGEVVGTRSG